MEGLSQPVVYKFIQGKARDIWGYQYLLAQMFDIQLFPTRIDWVHAMIYSYGTGITIAVFVTLVIMASKLLQEIALCFFPSVQL